MQNNDKVSVKEKKGESAEHRVVMAVSTVSYLLF